MANIFSDIIERFKQVPDVLKAKAKAGQAFSESRRVEGLLQKKQREQKPDVVEGNVFKDIVDRTKSAGIFGAEGKESVGPFTRESQAGRAFESAQRLGGQIREKVGGDVTKVAEAIPKESLNVLDDISRAGGAVARRYGLFAEPQKPAPFEVRKGETIREALKREPILFETTTAGVERTPIGAIPGVAPIAGFLSEFLLPPYGGALGKVRFARQLAKEGDVVASKLLIKQGIKDVSEEEAEMLARKTANLIDESAVERELEGFLKQKRAAKPLETKLAEPKREPEPKVVIGMREVFEGLPPEIRSKVDLRSEVTIDEARSIAKQLDKVGFSASKSQRAFRDEGGPAIVLGEHLRDPNLGTPDRIIFRPSKADRTKGTLSRILKPIQEEQFAREAASKELVAPRPVIGARKEAVEKITREADPKNLRPLIQEARIKQIDELLNEKIRIQNQIEPLERKKVLDATDTRKVGRLRAELDSIDQFRADLSVGVPPAKPPTPKEIAEAPVPKDRERKFGTAVKESPETAPELKRELVGRDLTYIPTRNKEIIQAAKERVAESSGGAMAYVREGTEATAEQVATSIELIRHFQSKGEWSAAADAAEVIAEKLTKAGQTVQAAKLYTHLKPEAILIRAQKLIRKLNERRFRWQKEISLDPAQAKRIGELGKAMNEAVDPALKVEFAEELQSILSNIPRPGILRKISMIQTIAQLLNPKTLLTRNPLGNEIFYRIERLNKYIASAIDWTKSTITGGDRVVTFHKVNQGDFWESWVRGAKAGWKGREPAGLPSQFDLHAPAFNGKWNPLTYLEKSLGASLRSFDFAAYKRAVNETLGELGWLRAKNEGLSGQALKDAAKKYATEASDDMLEVADKYGRYITFQDDNLISVGLQRVKRGLNVGQEFGVGDLVLKYPRTPGALMMRALEYSPAGFLRSAYLMARPILLHGVKANAREIELSLSRAITGSLGLTGLGYYLADKGIITGEPAENLKVRGIERAIGAGRYQINLSALKRWILSGFKDTAIREDDQLYSYDWAQPVAVSLSLGANMNKTVKESAEKREQRGPLAGLPGTFESSVTGAVETITEQPLLSGLKRLFSGESPVRSALSVIEDMPSSFTPTVLNQYKQVVDPVSRETWNSSMLQRSINRVKSRIPGLSDELPERFTTLGEIQKVMENPNLFNIFVSPGFLSTYKPTPSAQLVLEIYNETGETKQLPKVAPRSLVFQGKKVDLSGEQVSGFQERIGKATDAILAGLAANDKFKNAPNSAKADILSYALGKLYSVQKFMILTNEQRKILIESMDEDEKKSFAKELQSAL